jgi:ABC-2 type transport system permease protein
VIVAVLRILWASARVQMLSQRPLSVMMSCVVQPVVFLWVTMLAGGRSTVSTREAVGGGLLGLWSATVWQFGLVLRNERRLGTLPGIVCRPTGLTVVLVGKSLATVVRSTVLIVVTIGLFTAATGAPLRIAAPLAFAATLLTATASAAVLGLLLSSVFLLTRSALRIAETLTYPVFILGGLLVPVGVLPSWAQPLSTVVSLHWATELLAEAAAGRAQRPAQWMLLLATSVSYAVLSWVALRAVLRRVRAEGTLELV